MDQPTDNSKTEDAASGDLAEDLEEFDESEDLFRTEVLHEQGNKLFGEVVLYTAPRLAVFVVFFSILGLSLVCLLLFGRYQRKEKAPGVLVARQGIAQLESEIYGRITQVLTAEGTYVRRGQSLLTLTRETFWHEPGSVREQILQAPIDGYVSGFRKIAGENVRSGELLLRIVAGTVHFDGHFFISTKAAPFVQENQRVNVQFDSFAPTKYGVFEGVVQSVSRVPLQPEEVKDINLEGPAYLVVVQMKSHQLESLHQQKKLKAGMLIESNILLDKRNLIEWLIDPLLRM